MGLERAKMMLPGGEALIYRAAEIVFERFEAREARETPGYQPRKFADIPDFAQDIWKDALRPIVELSIRALLVDQAQVINTYDGSMGAAYQRSIHRYAIEELKITHLE
jgi:hypothetical protein